MRTRDGFAMELVAVLRNRYIGRPVSIDVGEVTSTGRQLRITFPDGTVFNCAVTGQRTGRPRKAELPK